MKIGDVVTWTSQAAGTLLKKTGKIIEVVPPRCEPNAFFHSTRSEESYVVEVPGKMTRRGRAKSKIYWPLATNLRSATAAERKAAGLNG